MKKQWIGLAVLVTFFLVLVAPAFAASVKFQGGIPFDFQIGSKKLPKGDYTISTINQSSVQLVIRNVKTGKTVTFAAFQGKMADKPKAKLSFRRYGDQNFLRKIWDGGTVVLEIKKSDAERQAAKAAKGDAESEGDEVPVDGTK